jgi:hypothetical protein
VSGGRIRTAQRAVIAVVLLVTAGFVAIVRSGAANADDPDTCGVPGNLVVNCGFESGGFDPGWSHSNPNDANAEGTVNGIDPHTGTSAYRDGSVDFTDFLSQDLTVVPGDSYRLSFFALNEEPETSVDSFVATVTVNHSGGGSTTDQLFADDGHTLTTSYSQQGGLFTVPSDATTTATLTFTIQQDPSYYDLDDVSVAQTNASVSLSASPEGGSTAGDSVTLTATVTGSGPDPTGTAEFDSNSSPISGCASQPVSTTSGTTTATCTTSDLATGSDSLTATYSGDGNYPSSQSSPLVYTVSPAPTPSPDSSTVTLHASPPGGSTDGDPVTLTAGVSGAGDDPTGSVQFDSNGSPIPGCASKPLSTSAGSTTATCQTSDLDVGDDTLLVIYSGDSNYTGGPSGPMGYQVTAAPTPAPTPSSTETPPPAPTPSSSSSVPCPPDNPCTVTVAAKGSNATATIHAKSGPRRTKVKASFGTADGKIHPCGAKKKAILTFSGERKKTIILKFHSSHPRHRFCYGQPKPFITASGHLTKQFNPKNNEYEGVLPRCHVTHTRPCVKRRHFHHKIQTVVVKSGKIDPHLSH